ncbi:hypothetical protein BC830DRAFT_1167755 [Chytriomyces sp. MP71]|nr:hypothetical protein BC830DRAFT_1167755 [Chytriomyces sp. MP71]
MESRASEEAQPVIPKERHELEAAQAILSLFDSRRLSSSSSSTEVKEAVLAPPSYQPGNQPKVRVRPCEGCKRRRKKCDAVRPVCSTCLLFNAPCVYSQSANWWYEKAQTS